MSHSYNPDIKLSKSTGTGDFGDDFIWGTATAAYQIEGAVKEGGRGPSIWDKFAAQKGKIKNGDNAKIACDFYHRYEEDLQTVIKLGFKNFRFSISWSRILPTGEGDVNERGVEFYNRLIDKCKQFGIEPWITLYHWDLPLALEEKGGWKNRDILNWFARYTEVCVAAFGDRVTNWVVMNEPLATAGLGYTRGIHAPGKRGVNNFFPVVHHLAMCQAEAGRIIRARIPGAYIGTALSCSAVEPASYTPKDIRAAQRADAVVNRLFIEPALGLGYPYDAFPFLLKIQKYIWEGDDEKLKFDFDFIGIQNYFNLVVQHSYLVPVLWLKELSAKERKKPSTGMGWEISPRGLYDILHQFNNYEGVRDIIVTENGAAFEDQLINGKVKDKKRTAFFKKYLSAVLQAKMDGVRVKGYFVWTFMDNFEWSEGYAARFGIVYVDFQTQVRTIKQSGKWFKKFLKRKKQPDSNQKARKRVL